MAMMPAAVVMPPPLSAVPASAQPMAQAQPMSAKPMSASAQPMDSDDDDVPIARLKPKPSSSSKNNDAKKERASAQLRHRSSPSVHLLLQRKLGEVTKTVAAAAAEALMALELASLSTAKPTFQFNGRLSRAQGRTRWVGGKPTYLELNSQSLSQVTGLDIYRTLLHEIAHVLAGPKARHGPAWRSIVYRIGGEPRRHCLRPHLVMRSRLTCTLHPEEHVLSRALTSRPEWRKFVGKPCPRCRTGEVGRIIRQRLSIPKAAAR